LIAKIIFGEKYRILSFSLWGLCLIPFEDKISYLVPSSRTPSTYVSPSRWKTKFRTHTNKGKNYSSVYNDLYIFR
jgi:hypothetical protein